MGESDVDLIGGVVCRPSRRPKPGFCWLGDAQSLDCAHNLVEARPMSIRQDIAYFIIAAFVVVACALPFYVRRSCRRMRHMNSQRINIIE